MPNILEVQIIGDISGLEKSLKDAEKLQQDYTDSIKATSDEIDKLNKQKIADKKLGIDVAPLNKQISKLQDNLIDLRGNLTKAAQASEKASDAIESAAKPLDNVGSSAEKTADSLSDIISPLGQVGGATEKVSEGADVLASSLSGGLAGAISAITGYLVKMYLEAQKAALAIHEVNNEAVESAGAEIATMNALVDVAKNDVNTREERLTAVQKLQDEYPAYFGNLTKEQILNGDVANAVKSVTFALIQKSKAQILANKIAENDLKILQLQQKGQKLASDYVGGKGAFALLKGATALQFLTSSANDTSVSIDELTKQQKEYTKELENSVRVANTFDAANDKASEKPKKTKKQKEDLTPKVEAIPKLEIAKSTDDQNDKILAMFRDQLSEDLTKLKTEPIKLNIPLQAVTSGSEFEAYALKLKKAQEDTQIFADGAGSAINVLANDLANSLSTGNDALDAFVSSVIQGLAQVAAAQLAGLIAKQAVATTSISTDAAVATGNAVVAATETASATGPAAAFVLPALVGAAIGFIAAAFSGIKFAHGGIVPGGSFTGDKIPAMLNSGETVMNQQQQANTLMAIANGNSNSLQSNRKSSTFNLESKVRGKDLLLLLNRAENER